MTSGQVLLAFDTSTPVGSVAVSREGEILARGVLLHSGEHAARLVPMISELLEEAGVPRGQISGVLVGRGPGSFTGVRIAAATARGLGTALGIPLWPRSSLAAGAASLGVVLPESVGLGMKMDGARLPREAEVRPRYVLFDARGNRVYAACYRFVSGRMETLVEPHAATVHEVLEGELPDGTLFCGDGALRHHALLESAGYSVLPLPAGLPMAEGLLRVHTLRGDEAPVTPTARWEPEYLRGSSARRPSVRGRSPG